MSNNAVKPAHARAIWNHVKTAAQQRGPSLLEGLAKFALDVWSRSDAGTKLSEDRATREAFIASLVGAAVVDVSLDKMAADGQYTVPEVEFLRDVNAEAALRDLGRFMKTSNYGTKLLEVLKNHPSAVGAVGGGLAGAGFGAYADDEDRLRGALRFGLPGAAMGAMLGHGAGQLRAENLDQQAAVAERALDAAREQQMHEAKLQALVNQAKPRVRSELELARDAEMHDARMKLLQAQTEAAARAHRRF